MNKFPFIINLIYKYYPYIVIITIPLLFFYPIFFGFILFPGEILFNDFYPWKEVQDNFTRVPWVTHNFFGSDPVLAHYPWKLLGIETIKSFQWPLWNPYSFAGAPLLANSQSALFYPLNIVYLFFNFSFAWSVISLLQIVLGGIFFYWFARNIKLSKQASLWGSLIYSFNGFIGSYFNIQVIGHTILWLPLILLSLSKLNNTNSIISQFSLKWFLVCSISIGSMFLAGHLQIASYCLFISFFFCLTKSNKVFLLFSSALVVGFCMASIQLIPTLDYLSKAQRDPQVLYTSFTQSPVQIMRLVVPNFYGHPNSNDWWGENSLKDFHAYSGMLAMVLAIIGMKYAFKEDKKYLFWVFLLAIFIIFTVDSPFTKLLYQLPIPFITSVTPSRAFGMIVFPIAILSAFGFEKLLGNRELAWKWFLIINFVLLSTVLSIRVYSAYAFNIYQFTTVKHALILPIFVLVITIVVGILKNRQVLSIVSLISLIFFIQTGDILINNKNLTRGFIENSQVFPDTQLTDFLKDNSDSRFLSLDLWLLIANSFIPYHIATITDYDAIHLKDSLNLVNRIFTEIPQVYQRDVRSIRFSDYNYNFAGMLNVKFVLSLKPLNDLNLKFNRKIDSVYIYENLKVLPRAYLVSDYKLLDKNSNLFDSSIDFKEIVFLSERLETNHSNIPIEKGETVSLQKENNQEYKLHIFTNKPRILFLSESFDSGWEAFVDNKKTKIYKANLSFQSVVVPAGEHNVKFVYKPLSFQLGLGISMISVSILIIFAIILLIKGFQKRDSLKKS